MNSWIIQQDSILIYILKHKLCEHSQGYLQSNLYSTCETMSADYDDS